MKYNFGVDKFRKDCKAYKLHAELENLRKQLAESEIHRQILTQQNARLLTQVLKDKETISHTTEGERLKTKALKTKHVTIRTGKHLFYCTCGCNVFHKPDNENVNLYQCNSCDTQYYGE